MHVPLFRFNFHLIQVVLMQHRAKTAIFDRLSNNQIFIVDFQAVKVLVIDTSDVAVYLNNCLRVEFTSLDDVLFMKDFLARR